MFFHKNSRFIPRKSDKFRVVLGFDISDYRFFSIFADWKHRFEKYGIFVSFALSCGYRFQCRLASGWSRNHCEAFQDIGLRNRSSYRGCGNFVPRACRKFDWRHWGQRRYRHRKCCRLEYLQRLGHPRFDRLAYAGCRIKGE